MEWWNIGMLVSKDISYLHDMNTFHVKWDFSNRPLSHFPRTHCSIIPLFHHSNYERSELSLAIEGETDSATAAPTDQLKVESGFYSVCPL